MFVFSSWFGQSLRCDGVIMAGSMLLYGLQSPINVGLLLRVSEVYRKKCFIVDTFSIFKKESNLNTISDFAVGALKRHPPELLSDWDIVAFVEKSSCRLIASSSSGATTDASNFAWRDEDCIMLGNEYDGLPEVVVGEAHALVRIPMPAGFMPKPPSLNPIDPARSQPVKNDGGPSLNVATAGAILAFLSYIHLQ